jgi:ketosteroid isomerase-like protein
MTTRIALAAVLLIAVSAAAGPVEEVRDAEAAFAKAFADRDATRFFRIVLDDATFLGGLRTMHGKRAVMERWSRFFESPQAPFSWAPERVVVNGAGTIGLSSGPVYDATGTHIANYASVWVRQPDGTWKILFDGPGDSGACFAANAAPFSEGDVVTADGAKLHFKKIGNAPTTIIVPAGALAYDDLQQLADMATVITYNPRTERSLQQDVLDLDTVRAHFNVDKFVPVGTADLGAIVATYAAAHPERVTRIVQLGPSSAKDVEVAKLTMPVLTIEGAKDSDAPNARAWTRLLPDARIVTIDGAAQESWNDNPAKVFAAMRAFLRGDWPLYAEQVKP